MNMTAVLGFNEVTMEEMYAVDGGGWKSFGKFALRTFSPVAGAIAGYGVAVAIGIPAATVVLSPVGLVVVGLAGNAIANNM
jgi:hypothetical protein